MKIMHIIILLKRVFTQTPVISHKLLTKTIIEVNNQYSLKNTYFCQSKNFGCLNLKRTW